jgi:hypothetical protein
VIIFISTPNSMRPQNIFLLLPLPSPPVPPRCIAGRLGCFPGVGALSWWSCPPTPPGGAGRRLVLLPHRRPWRAVVGAGSGLSALNKPVRGGFRPLVRDPAPLHRSGRGGEIGGNGLDSVDEALDLKLLVAGKLLPRCSTSQQPPLHSSAGRGGRRWQWGLLPHFMRAVVSLLVPPVPAGRGGEGLGVRGRDAAEGGNPRPPPSGGGGVAEWSDKIATAWRCGLSVSDLEAPPQISSRSSSWPAVLTNLLVRCSAGLVDGVVCALRADIGCSSSSWPASVARERMKNA